MKHKNNLLIVTVAIFVFLAELPCQAQFTYTTNSDNTITITGYTGSEGAVTVPDTISGLPVTAIGTAAFSSHTNLTGVSMPNTLTSIGTYAFSYCPGLTNITIPNGVTNIGDFAFSDCYGLTAATLPDGLTSIANSLFKYCNSLRNITIPNSVTNIGDSAFWYCTSLCNVSMGNGVTSIADYAFAVCRSMPNVIIPQNVLTVGAYAFASCTNLTNVMIPASVTNVGFLAFTACSSLLTITVDPANAAYSSLEGVLFDKTQTILIQFATGRTGNYAIPHTVADIWVGAFEFSSGLTNITVPNSVTAIQLDAFYFCTGLMAVYFEGNAPSFPDPIGFYQNTNVIIYYLPGTTGWGPTCGGRPTSPWVLPNPLVLSSSPSFGIQNNHFGFLISWATNVPVVVEASTDLRTASWSPIATNTLNNGSVYFSDPQWSNYPTRFYRIRSP